MDPLLGEAAQARAGPLQGGHEGGLSLPSSTLSSPRAWPHVPRPPVPSSGTSQDDALVLHPVPSPPKLFCYFSDGMRLLDPLES